VGRQRQTGTGTWLLVVAVAALRLATAAPDFGGVSPDTGNYLLGMQEFAPERARPHLPGAWLLIFVLRFLEPICGPHGALLAFAILCSAAAVGLAHGLFRRWFAPAVAWLLAGVVATQPMVWFYGCVPEVYAFDLVFGVLLLNLGLTRRGLLVLPVVFALGLGLRPTTPVLLLPLYACLWWEARGRWSLRGFWMAHAAGAAALVLVAWPLLAAVGGPTAYVGLYRDHLTVDWSLPRNLWGMSLFTATLAATVLVLLAGALATRGRGRAGTEGLPLRLLLAWALPPGLFFLLGHYQKGYALLIVFPLLAVLTILVAPGRRRVLLTGLVVLQVLYFLAAPYRTPSTDIFVAPAVRAMSVPEVWGERIRSTHLMAAARPRALAAAHGELEEILAAAPGDTLLLDPTFPLHLRAMQVRHPDRVFVGLDVHRPDGWHLHAGLAEQAGYGVAALLTGSLLVTSREFADTDPDIPGLPVVHRGDRFVALRIPPARAADLAARYADLFAR